MTSENIIRLRTGICTASFLILAALFFFPAVSLPAKVCYPTFALAFGSLLIDRRKLALIFAALFFSAIGDLAGSLHMTFSQIAAFAAAHICYIYFFLKNAVCRPHSYSVLAIICLVPFGLITFVPNVIGLPYKIAVAAYLFVISTMLYSVLQYNGKYKIAFVCAALLFAFSDATIAWTRFLGHIKHSSIIIMSSYYLAQYLFFLFAIKAKALSK